MSDRRESNHDCAHLVPSTALGARQDSGLSLSKDEGPRLKPWAESKGRSTRRSASPQTPMAASSLRALLQLVLPFLIVGIGHPAAASDRKPFVPVTFPDGFVVQAEVADTAVQRAKGLMFREALPSDRGMLFVFNEEGPREFWMKNTWVNLDLVFLGTDRRIRQVAESVPHASPTTLDGLIPRIKGVGMFVLEVPAGTCRQHHLSVGEVVSFNVSQSPRQ